MEKVLAWHFLSSKWTAHGDFKVEVGKTYKHEGDVEPCTSGLHASVKALDANSFRKGPVVTRVECSGTVIHHEAKLVCSERKALWGYDATEELRAFARWAALKVAHLWPKKNPMPPVVREYLETGNEALRGEAYRAAYVAANAAAYAAYAALAAAAAAYAFAAANAALAAADADAAYAAANAAAAYAHAADRFAFLADANAELERLLVEGAKKRGLVQENSP